MTDAAIDTKLNIVGHDELVRHLQLNLRKGHSLFITGGVGTGKTDSIYRYGELEAARLKRLFLVWVDLEDHERLAFANNQPITRHDKQYYLKDVYLMVVFNTLNKMPEDTSGIPMPSSTGNFVEWKPPLVFWVLAQRGAAGVLFLDEFLQAQQIVQKPMSDLFLNKQIADLRLQPDVGICGASNLAVEKCGTIPMLAHMENRTGHAELRPPTAKEWVEYMRTLDKPDEEGSVAKPRLDPRISMLIMAEPSMLYHDARNRKSGAYPTPRSWVILSDLIEGIDHEKDKMFFLHTVAMRVGTGAAAKFKAVLDHDMTTHGPAILQDPAMFHTSSWERRVAFTMWMSGHSKNDSSFLRKACTFLDKLGSHDMLDTMLYMMKSMVGPEFVREVSGTMRYPQAREALLDMAKAVGSLAE